jgi:hypothetical protein
VTHASVEDDLDDMDGNDDESAVTDTRFAIDLAPSGGFGFGRYLNAGSDLMLDAFERVLEDENILSRPLEIEDRRAIGRAIFDYSNDRSSYPRVSRAVAILQEGGYLVRSPSPRVIYRLIRVIDDPTFVDRPKGPLVRVGFVYGIPLVQNDYLRRANGIVGADTAVAGPVARFDMGIQLDIERQILIDTRVFYDALGDVTGFTTDSGATYTRHFHGRWSDYLGAWYVGLRGGASKRFFELADTAAEEGIGYRAMALAGYAYGFNRGSRIDVGVQVGVESGAFIVGAGLGLRFGIARGSVIESSVAFPREAAKARKSNAGGDAGGSKASAAGEAGAGKAEGGATVGGEGSK